MMRLARIVCLVWALSINLSQFIAAQDTPHSESLFFEAAVRPILKAHCFHCHGEAGRVEAGLDLRLVRFIRQGGESGAAVEPGAAEQSLLLQRVAAGEMPPEGKGLSIEERQLIAQWIDHGAQTARLEPETIDDQNRWTPEELNHWSFQPLVAQASPTIAQNHQASSPVDAWLLATLRRVGQSFSEPATRAQQLRRLTLDLTGLPPTIDEITRFEQSTRPDEYERQVDRLLASPAFGERWARRWLDVAGYADSDGYVSSDPVRPWAFRYRDWVIEAMDRDLSHDQFIIEQLAGDELPFDPDQPLSAERIANLTATGFLRMAPDGTAGGVDDLQQAQHDVVAETIKTVSTGLIGLTVGCARCHDHRYDPISQRDYFALASIFEPGFDLEQWRPPAARLINLWTAEDHEQAKQVEQRVAEIDAAYHRDLDALVEEIFAKKLAEVPEERREAAQQARSTPAAERDETHLALLREFPNLNVDRGSATLYEPGRVKELNDRRESELSAARSQRPAENFVGSFTEVTGRAPLAKLLYRGEAKQPRDPIAPADLSLLGDRDGLIPEDDPNLPSSGRRLAWARSLVDGRHPLLGRVWVNRIWAHYFGEGIVRTLGDFGTLGETPTHPALLDQLTLDWIARDWSNKWLHRRMVTSNAYRQASVRSSDLERLDPENRWLGRMTIKRMEAEMIRDSALAITDELYAKRFGPSLSVTQDEIGQIILGTGQRDGNGILVGNEASLGTDRFRRSLYVQVRRSMPLGLLDAFDPAKLDPNCPQREVSTNSSQALTLLNGRFTIERARALSDLLFRTHPQSPEARVDEAWRLITGFVISPSERNEAFEYLTAQVQAFEAATADDALGRDAERMAFDSLCHALLVSNRFLYY